MRKNESEPLWYSGSPLPAYLVHGWLAGGCGQPVHETRLGVGYVGKWREGGIYILA